MLFRVFPSRLKEEEMIKLPFNVVEHVSWEEAALRAVETRNRLARLAAQDSDYIRPPVLFQAEKKNQDCTVTKLRDFLLEQNIPEEQISIATGEQRELDAIDIFSRSCPVRYVITVEALKEGWDCSFAYVFCSVANIRSATDVEQLLGRVMRMPYARVRSNDKLNMAYAHVIANSFRDAAEAMYDRMIDMGFGEDEAAEQIQKPPTLSGAEDDRQYRMLPQECEEVAPLVIVLTKRPNLTSLAEAGKGIEVREVGKGVEIVTTCMISREAEEAIMACVPAKNREEVRKKIALHRRQVAHHMPRPLASEGEIFAVPRLLVEMDGDLEVVDPELLCAEWSPLDFVQDGGCPLEPGEFCYDSTEHAFLFDLQGERLVWQAVETQALPMLYVPDVEESVLTLSRKLDRLCRYDDIAQPVTLEFCRRCVQGLVERDGMDVTTLFVARRILAQCIRSKIDQFRKLARKRGFQNLLASPNVRVEKREGSGFSFPLHGYAEGVQSYAGAYQFRKHYYALPRDLKASGEEFHCAQAIDLHPAVKTWVRNVDRQAGSFWLPTSTDRFYPDFVVWLNDGRVLLVEYKGQHLLSSDDTREKRNVGALWAGKSDGRGAFMLVCEAEPELSFERQMEALSRTS